MKKLFSILAVILALALASAASTTGFDAVAISCNAVATTGACTTYNVSPADFVHIPSVQSFTWQTIIAGGTATSISVRLEGSVDGTTWTTLDTSTSTSGETRTKTPAAVLFFRCNVASYSTNGTTLTCQIMPTRATSGGGGGTWGSITGTVSDQTDLTPASIAAAASNASTTVNGQTCALSGSCTVADSTKVPTGTTVNGHALSSNVTVSASDLSTGSVPLANGGTNADLSASGAATYVLAQNASHVISARALVGADIPSRNATAVFSSPNCASPSAGNCYFANWDAHYVTDATTTSGSSTVTCPNSDCNFTSTDGYGRPIAKVGQIVFVTSDPLKGATTCPQTTIATINSAQSITLTAATDCTATLTATGSLFWGDDDTTALNNAWLAAKCGVLQLPGPPVSEGLPGGIAMAMFQSALFTATPTCDSATNIFTGPSLYGAAVQSTYLLATPNFDFSTCTGGHGGVGASIACTGGVINGHYRDFSIWGGGATPTGTAWRGKALFELGPAARAESIDVLGWGALVAGGTVPMTYPLYGILHNSQNGWFSEGGALFAGNVACASAALQTIWEGNACEVTNAVNQEAFANQVLTGASSVSIGNSLLNSGNAGCVIDVIGALNNFNDLVLPVTQSGVSGLCIETGGQVYSYGQTTVDVSAQTGATALYLRGTTGKAYLTGTVLKGGSASQDIYMTNAASQIFDLGGNQFNGATHVGNSGTGQIIGNLSQTGVLATSSKLALSANWGTSNSISTMCPKCYNTPILFTITNGTASTGTAPTITYTFPSPYLQPPLWCTATQAGGTNAAGTFSAGTPTVTSVVFTYSLTPTANSTEIVQVACANK